MNAFFPTYTGLPSYTDFEVSVSALSESGSGPYSSPVLIKTSESSKLEYILCAYNMFDFHVNITFIFRTWPSKKCDSED